MATYATFALAQTAAAGAADWESTASLDNARIYRDAVRAMLLFGMDAMSAAGKSFTQSRAFWENELARVNAWIDANAGATVSNANKAHFTRGRPV